MPKVTVKYNLPDERVEYKHSINGSKYFYALQDILGELRGDSKYGEGKYSLFYTRFNEIMNEENIDLWSE